VINATDLEQLRSLLDQLKNDDPEVRLHAARGLRQIGLRYRPKPAVRTRGSLSHPARGLLPKEDQDRIAQGASDPNRLVRGEMALAVGDFCDEMPVDELIQMARFDADGRVREAVAQALTLIGGPRAAKALGEMARTDPNLPVVTRAAEGLEVLLQATTEPPHAGAVRTRGALSGRTRGAGGQGTPPEVADVLDVLNDLRHHPDPTIRQAVDRASSEEGAG